MFIYRTHIPMPGPRQMSGAPGPSAGPAPCSFSHNRLEMKTSKIERSVCSIPTAKDNHWNAASVMYGHQL